MLFFVFVTCVIHFRHQNKARKISLCGFCFHFNDCYLRPMAIQWNDLKNIISLKIPPWNDILFHFCAFLLFFQTIRLKTRFIIWINKNTLNEIILNESPVKKAFFVVYLEYSKAIPIKLKYYALLKYPNFVLILSKSLVASMT